MPISPRIQFVRLFLCLSLLLLVLPQAAHALGPKGDVYLGYSRLGSDAFYPNVGGLNGWEGAMQVKLHTPFLGVEADVSQYGLGAGSSVPRTTAVMAGPRVTLGALAFKVYLHGLVGMEHSSNSAGVRISDTKPAYALGGGVDVPLAPFFAWRVGGDYLNSTSSPGGGSHARFTTGLVFRF